MEDAVSRRAEFQPRERGPLPVVNLPEYVPVAFAVALVSGLSMAGVPPLLGFPAKEAAIEAAPPTQVEIRGAVQPAALGQQLQLTRRGGHCPPSPAKRSADRW